MRKYVRTARGVEKTILQRSRESDARATSEDGNFSLTLKCFHQRHTFTGCPDAAVSEILGCKRYNAQHVECVLKVIIVSIKSQIL